MNETPLIGLDPLIKLFIYSVAVLGPLCIVFIILALKKIEKKSPERIRWR